MITLESYSGRQILPYIEQVGWLRAKAHATPDIPGPGRPVQFSFNWPTIQSDGTVVDQKNGMHFWTKHLSNSR